MAKVPKFPLEVFDVPQVKRLTAVQYGLFARLAFSFWETGIPLPENPYAIARLANSDLGTIARHRDIVLECIRLVMPKLQERYVKREIIRSRMRELSEKARFSLAIKTRIRKQAQSALLSDENEVYAGKITVIPSRTENSRQNPDHYNQSARKAALDAPKAPEKTLMDD